MTENFVKVSRDETPQCPNEGGVTERMIQTRTLQMQAIEDLTVLMNNINGKDGKISQLPEWKGLVDLSLQLESNGKMILELVSECRRLIG